MIDVRKFKLEHLERFKPESFIPQLGYEMAANFNDPTKDIVSLLDINGEVIAFAGINHLRTGVGEVWVIRSEFIKFHKFSFYKTCLRLVEFCLEIMDLHRLELAVNVNHPEWFKWAEKLGFKFEGKQERYDYLGNDHLIYVRFNNG